MPFVSGYDQLGEGVMAERGSPEIPVLSLFPSPASGFPHGTTGLMGGCWGGSPSVFATGDERTGVMSRW